MVRRGEDFFVPTGNFELEIDDHLLLITYDDAMLAAQYYEAKKVEEKNHEGMQFINNTWAYTKQKWNQLVHPKK